MPFWLPVLIFLLVLSVVFSVGSEYAQRRVYIQGYGRIPRESKWDAAVEARFEALKDTVKPKTPLKDLMP